MDSTIRVRESLDLDGDLMYEVHLLTYSRSALDKLAEMTESELTFIIDAPEEEHS